MYQLCEIVSRTNSSDDFIGLILQTVAIAELWSGLVQWRREVVCVVV